MDNLITVSSGEEDSCPAENNRGGSATVFKPLNMTYAEACVAGVSTVDVVEGMYSFIFIQIGIKTKYKVNITWKISLLFLSSSYVFLW